MPIKTYLDVEASYATFYTDEYVRKVAGLTTWKMGDDLDRYARIIEQTRPELVIETGTKWGGSARWFESRGVDVITVDIDGSNSKKARPMCTRVEWVVGDSAAAATASQVRDLIRGRRTMVSLDAEHAAPHVHAEILLYREMVSPGCYLVVEDGIFDLVDPARARRGGERIPAEGGPLLAIEQTMVGLPGWVRDGHIEQLTAKTYHPAGFWQRLDPETGL
jgi:cephalosporin hydroxylase